MFHSWKREDSEPKPMPSDKPTSVPLQPVVLFSDSFSHPARSKLEFLQGMGGRVVELVLEDCDGKTVAINRWGRCTWSDPFCAGCKYDGVSSWRCLFRTITFGGCKVCKQNPQVSRDGGKEEA